jgi:hypothetical protein
VKDDLEADMMHDASFKHGFGRHGFDIIVVILTS